jgi:hypothetical protein
MKPQDDAGADDCANQKAPRKAYEKPRVEIYGDLAGLSKSLQSGPKTVDGSGHPNKHFTT